MFVGKAGSLPLGKFPALLENVRLGYKLLVVTKTTLLIRSVKSFIRQIPVRILVILWSNLKTAAYILIGFISLLNKYVFVKTS